MGSYLTEHGRDSLTKLIRNVEFNKSWIRNPMQTAHEQRASLATMQRVLCRRGVPGAYLAPPASLVRVVA